MVTVATQLAELTRLRLFIYQQIHLKSSGFISEVKGQSQREVIEPPDRGQTYEGPAGVIL